MAVIDKIEETADVQNVNEKLSSGWILLETLCNSANQSVKYVIGRKRQSNRSQTE